MGTSGSTCAETPVRAPYNQHLSNALDPRSPSAGILRTPIEVLSSQSPDHADAESEEEMPTAMSTVTVGACGSSAPSDPRSPTPGVNRTPFKISVTAKLNHLVRQLSAMYVSEEAVAVGHLPAERGDGAEEDEAAEEEEGSSAMAVDWLSDCEEEGGDGSELPASDRDRGEARPALEEMAAATTPTPSGTGPARPGSRPLVWTDSRPRVARRNLAPGKLPAPGTIRSPLQPLAGSNSPGSALGLRQIHKAAASERIQDAEAQSTMKAGPPDRALCQDKENNSCLLTL